MLTEEQKAVHSEYRKYLRIVEGIKGNMLNGRVKQQVQFTLIVCKTQLWVC
ncbi:hypothetical protein ING2E5A_1914 [Petrimonas mucosa]|uniref:Uncharacterized protein n=1 Tax=Petrimonas mucosa TaxID=1642646 RepID=A0A1G4G878_9BACT|nr:hypothetical protein ING2E5A_1914 [Petrimonas mucosa]